MANLTGPRKTDVLETQLPVFYEAGMGANAKIWEGAIVTKNPAGDLVTATGATGYVAVGVADATYDNTSGATGATTARARMGVAVLANSGGDPVTKADIGNVVYIENDSTVSRTNGGSQSPAGRMWGLITDSPLGATGVAVSISLETIGAGATGATGPTGPTGPTSLAAFKNGIEHLTPEQEDLLALQVLEIKPATYRYNADGPRGSTKLGFIIDELEHGSPAVDRDGMHVDMYGYTTMLVATLKSQQRKIEQLTAQVAKLTEKA